MILNWFPGLKKVALLGKSSVKAGGRDITLAEHYAKSTTFFGRRP